MGLGRTASACGGAGGGAWGLVQQVRCSNGYLLQNRNTAIGGVKCASVASVAVQQLTSVSWKASLAGAFSIGAAWPLSPSWSRPPPPSTSTSASAMGTLPTSGLAMGVPGSSAPRLACEGEGVLWRR